MEKPFKGRYHCEIIHNVLPQNLDCTLIPQRYLPTMRMKPGVQVQHRTPGRNR
jgi:hypothetical protein